VHLLSALHGQLLDLLQVFGRRMTRVMHHPADQIQEIDLQ